MNISALSTPTQVILAWSLVGVLLLWLVIFSALALRTQQIEQNENDMDETPTPAGSFPAITLQVMHSQTSLAQVSVHVPGTQTPGVPISSRSGRALPQIDRAD